MRESCATWYFSQISPTPGILSLKRSILVRADSFRAHNRKPTIAATTPPAIARMEPCAAVPTVIRIRVMAGRSAWKLSYRLANRGTTKVTRKTIRKITSTISTHGYISETRTFFFTASDSFW